MNRHKIKYIRWIPYAGEIELRAKNISLAKAEARSYLSTWIELDNVVEHPDNNEPVRVRLL